MYSVEVVNKNSSFFTALSEGHEVTIDTKGGAISPPAMLLASLGSCIGVYIRKYKESAKIGLDDFSIKIKADFCKAPQVHFKNIDVFIDLKGADLDDRRKNALLTFIKNCPVHNTLKSIPDINIEIG